MAKPYLTVTHAGKTHRRQTDRQYTHAVVLTAWSETAYAARYARELPHTLRRTLEGIAHDRAIVAAGLGGVYPGHEPRGGRSALLIDQWSLASATKHLGDKTDDQLLAEAASRQVDSYARNVSHLKAKGDDVLSWHGSRALAEKAMARYLKHPSCYTLVIVEVDKKA